MSVSRNQMERTVATQNRKLCQITGAIVVFLAVSGLVDGRFIDTADSEQKLTRVSQSLEQLPLKCGDWVGTSLDTNPEELKVAEAAGAILRRYTHRLSGNSVTVLVLCGPPGPISVHPPTACYQARGYRLSDVPRRAALEGKAGSHEVLTAEFTNPAGFAEDRVGITWSWSTDGQWMAPENPRLEFANESALFKLYITWDRGGDPGPLAASIPKEFFQTFQGSFKEHMSGKQAQVRSSLALSTDR
ncbi:MAG: hypothetical protein ACI92S_003810 [Planctomycetaceae bacterium]|jgi:hypothetical protein